MIARIWTGATRDEDADAYAEYMREVAVPGYTNVAGHRTLLMLRRPRGDGSTEFTMVTCWDDMESITAFTGPDPEPPRRAEAPGHRGREQPGVRAGGRPGRGCRRRPSR